MTKLLPKQSKDDYMQTASGKVANFLLPEVEIIAQSPTGSSFKDRNLYKAYKGRNYISQGRLNAEPLMLGLAGLTAAPALTGIGISSAIKPLDVASTILNPTDLLNYTPFVPIKVGKVGKVGQYLKDLRYELDPRYRRIYHRTEAPFDINNFHTGTSNDAGLHVSPGKPANDILGSVIYKGYSKKPDFRFVDVGSNGTSMFNTNYTFKNPSWINTGNDKLSKNVFKKMFGNLGEWTKLDNGGSQIQFSAGEVKTNPVNLIEHIFPNLPKDFKLKLSEFYRVGTYVNDAKTKALLNSKLAKFLSDNNFKVGVYNNHNYDEMVGDAYSIFSNDAVKNWTRILKSGGVLNKNTQLGN